ncbi:zinc finger MYM-type protein 1 [Trichonephila clavipes]|nr:zinc finger MYM-type protein 1 [Trichonephila clavipes]
MFFKQLNHSGKYMKQSKVDVNLLLPCTSFHNSVNSALNNSESFFSQCSTPIDADLREQILKLGPYQPEGNFQKDAKARSFSSSYYSFISKAGQKIERKWLCYSTRLHVAYCQAKCRGQGYDGVTNMSGAYGVLQKLIKDKQPKSNYVHCSIHNLNLVPNDACNNVPHNDDAVKLILKKFVLLRFYVQLTQNY